MNVKLGAELRAPWIIGMNHHGIHVGALVALLACFATGARAATWQPGAGLDAVAIWPGTVPDSDPVVVPESLLTAESNVAGRPWRYLVHVSRPTMTVFPARGRNTGAAVIVFPGGGYHILAIDLEGTEVCEWLASRGITAVLLAYRVPLSGPHWDKDCHCHRDPVAPAALEDAQRTVGLVRVQAARWGVDPRRIGVLGFSAGGHLVADVCTHWQRRAYAAVDAADSASCRPDFGVALYPGHLLEHTTHELELNPTVPVTPETPPTFLLQATDDPVDDVQNSLVYYLALQQAKVPVELHLFAHGGHAFGLRTTSAPITHWPELLEGWLGEMGFTGKR
jgi:acetyl esterase/lipase